MQLAVPAVVVLGALGVGAALAFAIVGALFAAGLAISGRKKSTNAPAALAAFATVLFAWIAVHEFRYAAHHPSSAELAEILGWGATAGFLLAVGVVWGLNRLADAVEYIEERVSRRLGLSI